MTKTAKLSFALTHKQYEYPIKHATLKVKKKVNKVWTLQVQAIKEWQKGRAFKLTSVADNYDLGNISGIGNT